MRRTWLPLLLLLASPAARGRATDASAPVPFTRATRVRAEQQHDGGALAQLLQAIAQRWEQQQQRNSGRAAGALAVAQWQDALSRLARAEASLAAFAEMAASNELLNRGVAAVGMPAALIAPDNAALARHLAAAAARSGGNGSLPAGSSWQSLVQQAKQRPAAHLPMLLRHIIPARQPLLLDASADSGADGIGSISLEAAVGYPVGFGASLVLQTGLDSSYIQVAQLPISQTTAAAAAENATAAAVNSSSSSSAPLLRVGSDQRLLRPALTLQPSGLLVLPLGSVLQERDEAVNAQTASRLRLAFGLAPEDEQALLSTLHPASLWPSAQQQPGSGGANTADAGSAGSEEGGGYDDAAAAATAERLARQQQQQQLRYRMADALADSLVTIEALSAWTSAVVLSPGVFNMPAAAAAAPANSSSSSSSSSWDAVDWSCGASGGAAPTAATSITVNSSALQGSFYVIDGGGSGGGGAGACCCSAMCAAASPGGCAGSSGVDVASTASLTPWQLFPSQQLRVATCAAASSNVSAGGKQLQQAEDTNSSNLNSSSSSSSDDDLAFASLRALAAMLADGRTTPVQLAGLFLGRLKRYNKLLNSAITFTDSLAAQQADAAAQLLSLRRRAPPCSSNSSSISLLAGIPFGLKDIIAVPGYPTSWGLSALQHRVIPTPSWAFTALAGAGGVLLAKTATGELAWGDSYFDGVTTRNPWHVETGSCGSSGGSAVAVAAGLLPVALGTETWGSLACPAFTVGVAAYRPTGGSISTQGVMQVAASLDKLGVFCRDVLDCAVVADALMDTSPCSQECSAAAAAAANASASSSGGNGSADGCAKAARLHRQDAAAAAAFNSSQAQQLPPPPAAWVASPQQLLPPSFAQLPRLQQLCIGYLEGTPASLLDVLRGLGAPCLRGPLPPPGNSSLVKGVLSVLLQAEVAVAFEGLWLEGLLARETNHWSQLIQLGQVLPASAYLKAQRLRGLLLRQAEAFFRGSGISVLLKPARTDIGMDGLASLLGLPEVLLPTGFTTAVADGLRGSSGGSTGSGKQQRTQQASEDVDDDAPPTATADEAWIQPAMGCVTGLPGNDAAVVAVAAAFQSVTRHHLARPPLEAGEAGERRERQQG